MVTVVARRSFQRGTRGQAVKAKEDSDDKVKPRRLTTIHRYRILLYYSQIGNRSNRIT
jgi:hypothetical protein